MNIKHFRAREIHRLAQMTDEWFDGYPPNPLVPKNVELERPTRQAWFFPSFGDYRTWIRVGDWVEVSDNDLAMERVEIGDYEECDMPEGSP